jgi:hypothetical protein
VAGSELDHHRAVAEHVVILALEQHGLALFQTSEVGRVADASQFPLGVRARREDGIAIAFLHNPGRPSEQVGIRHMVAMIVRKRQIGDVRRRVANGGELRQQRTIHREGTRRLRRDSALECAIGDLAGVPHQSSARVDDQKARGDHIRRSQLARLEPHRVSVRHRDLSAIEDIEPQRLRRRGFTRLRLGVGPACQTDQCGGGKKNIRVSADHVGKHTTVRRADRLHE